MKSLLRLLSATCLLSMTSPSFADDQWEITVNVAMTGMPFNIPAQTHTICTSSANTEQSRLKMIPTEDGCTTSNIKSTPSSMSLHIECPAPKKMSGDLKVTYSGNSYKGEMTTRGNFDGHDADMKMTYSGKKIGSCAASENTVSQATQMMKKQQAMLAQQQATQDNYMSIACSQAANEMNVQTAAMVSATCPNLHTDICKVFNTKTSTPKSLRQFKLEKGDSIEEIANYCAIDMQAINQQACTTAKSQKQWLDASEFCGEDSELAAIAAKECTGLIFTSMPSSDPRRSYAPLCSRYASKAKAQNNGGLIDSSTKAIEGINKLRGLFGH